MITHYAHSEFEEPPGTTEFDLDFSLGMETNDLKE
jgi:hypothetical protein